VQTAAKASTGLQCSVGVGDNKLQAKTATRLAKPEGVARLDSGTWPATIGPLAGFL
jgi:DNA polymerase-4